MQNRNDHMQGETYETSQENGPYIHVDFVATKIAFLYERVRQAIDYQEEHLLRTNGIERILRRRVFFSGSQEPFALELIQELIRGGYFFNDSIPENKVNGMQAILDKYIAALNSLRGMKSDRRDIASFLYGVAACEIEEFLDPAGGELILLELEYEILRGKLRISGVEISDEEKDLLLFTAVNQTLLHADTRRIYFRLMQKLYPGWFESGGIIPDDLHIMAQEAMLRIDGLLAHHALKRLRNAVRPFAIVFQIISDITGNDPSRLNDLAVDQAMLAQEVERAYMKRSGALRAKLRRASFRSVVSIFLSKVFIALALEIPFELFIAKHVVLYPLFVSILFPPFLMLLIVWRISVPPLSNMRKMIPQVRAIIDGTFVLLPVRLQVRRRGSVVSFILGVLQFLMVGISFGSIIFILDFLNFSILSMIVFIGFLSLIIFSGTRIKQWSDELTIEEKREGVIAFIVDILSLPIINFGKLLSGKLSRFNIVILFLNLFFEAPLQSFIQFIEEWRKFIREKKEEL